MKPENKEIKEISIWYAQESAKITEQHGQPNKSEESKRLHKNLRQAKSRKLRDLKAKMGLEELKDQLTINAKASLKWTSEDVAPYDRIEQLILMKKFSNMVLTNGDIAKSLSDDQVSQQQVTSLLERSDVNELITRLFSNDLSKSIQIQVMQGVAAGDIKWAEFAVKYGMSPTGSTNGGAGDHLLSKPIEDPDAMKALQTLGDWLCVKGISEIMEKVSKWDTGRRSCDLVFPKE